MAEKDYSYLKGRAGRKRIKFTEEDFENIERWAGNGLLIEENEKRGNLKSH